MKLKYSLRFAPEPTNVRERLRTNKTNIVKVTTKNKFLQYKPLNKLRILLQNINMTNSDNKWWFNKKFHEKLAEVIENEYGLKCAFTNLTSWGYTTTAYYVETNKGNLIARLSKNTAGKIEKIEKEVKISNYLRNIIPTTHYIRNLRGCYIIHIKNECDSFLKNMALIENTYLRVSKHIEGIPPFDMNFIILEQMVKYLKIIHEQNPNIPEVKLKKYYPNKKNQKLLHGDLTPSNVLLSYGNITGILDFEEAMIGPVEWDLSRTAVFSWFRMHDLPFKEVLKFVLEKYDNKDVSEKLTKELSKKHLEDRVENLVKNKYIHEDIKFWNEDYEFTKDMLSKIDDTL